METVSKHLSPDGFANRRVLEIGSYDVNGSIRSLFPGSIYTGVDLIAGPGVDIVCEGNCVAEPTESYDITVSCECFEHNPKWLETFLNMHRMTKLGGILIFTCATTGRVEHGTSRTNPVHSPGTQQVGWDYYMNLTESDFRKNISFESFFDSYLFLRNRRSNDLYFIGQKTGGNNIYALNTKIIKAEYTKASRELEARISKHHPYSRSLRALAFLSLIPVSIAAALLPERYFQNFAVHYCKIDSAMKAWSLKLLLRQKAR
jgi:SAM-dependent methyltransferase